MHPSPELTAMPPPNKPRPSLARQLGMPAVAGGVAVCFSHPLELTKNFKADGVRGLQRGLSLGITREVCFNAVRIGLLESVTDAVHATASATGLADASTPPGGTERLVAGLTCGALGGCCVNPIEVLKTRFQAQGGLTGFQHSYEGPVSALMELARAEGVAGLLRGVGVSTLRGLLGPGSQIVAYNEAKRAAVARGADGAAPSTHVASALASAAVSIACVNPVDVVRTRLYNAPPGRYAGGVDAGAQLVRIEGPLALYKGALTHYLRLGPHMVLVFGILEQLKRLFP